MDIVIEAKTVLVCLLGFLCVGGFSAAVIIGGTHLSKSRAAWEDEDDLE